MSYQSINPNTGKTLKTFEHLNKAQLEKSLATAESCFQTWKHTSYKERAAIVEKAAKLMRELIRAPKFVDFLTLPAYTQVLKEEGLGA